MFGSLLPVHAFGIADGRIEPSQREDARLIVYAGTTDRAVCLLHMLNSTEDRRLDPPITGGATLPIILPSFSHDAVFRVHVGKRPATVEIQRFDPVMGCDPLVSIRAEQDRADKPSRIASLVHAGFRIEAVDRRVQDIDPVELLLAGMPGRRFPELCTQGENARQAGSAFVPPARLRSWRDRHRAGLSRDLALGWHQFATRGVNPCQVEAVRRIECNRMKSRIDAVRHWQPYKVGRGRCDNRPVRVPTSVAPLCIYVRSFHAACSG